MEEKWGIPNWKILFSDDKIIRYWIHCLSTMQEDKIHRYITSQKKHFTKQQIIPDWNILTRHNFNNSVFHFGIWWQINLPEGVFGIINHYGLSVVNQLKKTTNELIFMMRKWVENFLAAVPTLPIASANAVLMLDFWYLLRRKVICPSWVTGRLFLEVCFKHLFLVDMELNQSTSYAANFGSWVFRISIRWAFFLAWGLSNRSLFLIFNVNNKRDDILDAADIDDGDDVDKKFVDKWEDTFNAIEDDGDNLDTNKIAPTDGFGILQRFNADLPFLFFVILIFCGVDVLLFIMVMSMSDFWKWGCLMWHGVSR